MVATVSAAQVKQLAHGCGFELAGVTPAMPSPDYTRFEAWRANGNAGEMSYLTDDRGDLRSDPRHLLPNAQTILCLGKLYNTSASTGQTTVDGDAEISRYARGFDYHESMREQMQRLVERMAELAPEPFESRICLDTAPLLERSYAQAAGLGWIGKNTCLINQDGGSWFLLGEILLSLPLETDLPAPFRCGTCTRCIDACPTEALVPDDAGGCELDARLCISYLTIEKRGPINEALEQKIGNSVFGCDICQDVCPWNRRAPVTEEDWLQPIEMSFSLERLAGFSAEDFRERFRRSPVWRAKYSGFLRNVAIAIGNSRRPELRPILVKLSSSDDTLVSETAERGLARW